MSFSWRRLLVFGGLLIFSVVGLKSEEVLKIGYAVMSPQEGSLLPAGTALFSLRDESDVLVWEAGVSAVAPVASARIFVDQAGTRTALAVVNTSNAAQRVDLSLRDSNGQLFDQNFQDFAPGQHLAIYVDEYFALPDGFVGTLTLSTLSGEAVLAPITLRESRNLHNQPLFATLPVAELGGEGDLGIEAEIIFPQVGAGGGLSTQIVLINVSDLPVAGTIRFTDSSGNPLQLEQEGVSDSEFPYQIQANGVYRASFEKSSGVGVGYAVVVVDEGSTPVGTALFQFRDGTKLISEAGVAATPATTQARIFVDNARTRTGVALANPSDNNVEITFRLLNRFGQLLEETTRELKARRHLSIFADELFSDLLAGFTGQIEILSDSAVVPITLKLTTNSRGEPILTTLPVVDLTRVPPRTIQVFPQIGVGFGFSTRLISLSYDLGAPSGGVLSFFSSDGSQLEVSQGDQSATQFEYEMTAGGVHQFFTDVRAGIGAITIDESRLTINQGNMVPLVLVTLDELGNPRHDFELNFTSTRPDVLSVSDNGNLTGINRGFSTLVISSGGVVATGAVTVATITSGFGGFEATGVSWDLSGRIYLANRTDNTILRAPALGQDVVLHAGVTGNAGFKDDQRLQSLFNAPGFLTYDQSDGTLYVTDSSNHAIRSIGVGESGLTTTLTGTGTSGSQDGSFDQAAFSGPEGIALDEQGRLWVADSKNHTIRIIDLASQAVETVAGMAGLAGLVDGEGSTARFREPVGLAIEVEPLAAQLEREFLGQPAPPTSVIVADSGNGVLRRVFEDGTVETIATVDTAASPSDPKSVGYRQASRLTNKIVDPTGLAVDSFGNIYVSERATGRVLLISPDGKVVTAAQRGTFTRPQGIAISLKGRLLVADAESAVSEIRYAGPSIEQLEPNQVSSKGGQRVFVSGRNFATGGILVMGGVVIRDFVYESSELLSFVTPQLPSGRQTLTFQHRGGLDQTFIDVVPQSGVSLQTGEITTVAGGSTFAGDGFAATDAKLSIPKGVSVSADGEIYIADSGNNRIRKVDSGTGVITTVVDGQSQSVGLLSLLGDASLSDPSSTAKDRFGNLYFADSQGHRVYRLRSGAIRAEPYAGTGTLGSSGDGGPATRATLNSPSGLAVDRLGNLYIADSGNHLVRRVDYQEGVIMTVAGSGKPGFIGDGGPATRAALFWPRGLAVSATGRLLIADMLNNVIRHVDLKSGVISTIAGNGEQWFSGDGGPPTDASLNQPSDVAFGQDNSYYIADSGNHRIRRVENVSSVNRQGSTMVMEIDTVAGLGEPGFFGDGDEARKAGLQSPLGVAVDGAGRLLIADTGNDRIRLVDPATSIISTLAGGGSEDVGDGGPAVLSTLNGPVGLALGDRFYIADSLNHRVRYLHDSSARKSSSPQSINLDGRARIETLAGTGFAGFADDFVSADDSPLNRPAGVAVDSNERVYFSERRNHVVRQVDLKNILIRVAGNGEIGYSGEGVATQNSLAYPTGVAIDPFGNLIVADTANHRIRRIDIEGQITTIAGTGTAGFSGDGNRAIGAQLNYPFDVAVAPSGSLLIADTGNNRIREIDGQGIIRTVAGDGKRGFSGDGISALETSLNRPVAVLATEDSVIISDTSNARVRRVDSRTGLIHTIAGNGQEGFSGDGGPAVKARINRPAGLVIDSLGNLFFADHGNGRIRVIRGPVR